MKIVAKAPQSPHVAVNINVSKMDKSIKA